MEVNQKKIEELHKEISLLLYNVFVTNTYAFAFQREDGKYQTKYLPLSECIIEEMLNQKSSIGCYQQCYKSNMLKWICFDFDSADKERPNLYDIYEKNIVALKQICDEYNIRYLTEFSGRRGFHLWIVFSHLIPKDKAFYILNYLKKKLILKIGEITDVNIDLFPATDSAKDNKLGKQVKLPLSYHKSGKQSWLFEGAFSREDFESKEVFLKKQIDILERYEANNYEEVIKNIGIIEDEYVYKLKYKKYKICNNIELSIDETINILSETKVYSEIFQRLCQGKAFREDWLVVMGTFSPLNDGGLFIKELYSIFPNYDSQKTIDNITRYKDRYYPATFDYLYMIYGLDIEDSINGQETGFSYIMNKMGIKTEVSSTEFINIDDNKICVEDTIKKEINYILYNDEVLNVSIWNEIKSIKQQDIKQIKKIIENIYTDEEIYNHKYKPNAIVYERYETEKKTRKLVSLSAKDRIITTHAALLLQRNQKKKLRSFSYNVSFCSREEIFYNWYSSWNEFINKIKAFIEVPLMWNYEVFTIDLKDFYDHIDFISMYNLFCSGLNNKEKKIFKFLIDYNDMLMREISDGKRKGVPQGPAYARVLSEIYIDSIISRILSKYDESIFHLYRYVDDIVFFVKPDNESHKIYNNLIDEFLSYGLPINEEKSRWYGSIRSLSEDQVNKILRKGNFVYDFQDNEEQEFITMEERKKDINNYFLSNEFDIGDVCIFFNNKTYYGASESYLRRYIENIMKSQIGRGSAFKKFYEYLVTHDNELDEALSRGFFNLIPLNSINFGNFLGELYLLIQEHKIEPKTLVDIKDKYLSNINFDNLSNEYKVLVESIMKIKITVDENDK